MKYVTLKYCETLKYRISANLPSNHIKIARRLGKSDGYFHDIPIAKFNFIMDFGDNLENAFNNYLQSIQEKKDILIKKFQNMNDNKSLLNYGKKLYKLGIIKNPMYIYVIERDLYSKNSFKTHNRYKLLEKLVEY